MKKKFLSILAAFAVLVSFSACQAGDTSQTPLLSEVVVSETIIDVDEPKTFEAISTLNSETAVTGRKNVDTILEYDTANSNLITADTLIDIVFKAKKTLYDLGEVNSDMSYYVFGVIDANFDGFPELFCDFDNGGRGLHNCRLYSLNNDDFCMPLLDFNAFDIEGITDFKVRNSGDKKSLVIYTEKIYGTRARNKYIFEITCQDGNYVINELFQEQWDVVNNADGTYKLIPECFWVNTIETSQNEYEDKFKNFILTLSDATYVYENIKYTSKDIVNIKCENNELYALYSEYINSICEGE